MEQLPWIADVKSLQRRTPAGPYHLYRYTWISRPDAVPRLLESPTPLLRETLRRLLEEILRWVPVHPAAHGFVRGRSVLTHASAHVDKEILVSLDLRTFFAAITAPRVDGIFGSMGYPEAVVRTLTGLTTHRTPGWVLARMPPGGAAATATSSGVTCGCRTCRKALRPPRAWPISRPSSSIAGSPAMPSPSA